MYYEIEGRFNMKTLIFDEEKLTVGDRVFPYSQIEDISLANAPLFATYGLLKIRTGGKDITVPFTRSSGEKIRRALHEMERLREAEKITSDAGSGAKTADNKAPDASGPGPAAGTGAGPVQTDPYEEAKKLKELLDLGIITEEEFQRKKKEILGL